MAEAKTERNTLPGEVWKDIPGTNGDYCVSSTGRVYSNRYRRFLKPTLSRGYLFSGIGRKSYGIHQLVAMAFHGYKLGQGKEVNHIDGNKLNNDPRNLEVVSHRDNMKHAWRTSLITPEKTNKHCVRDYPEGSVLKIVNDYVSNTLGITRKEFEQKTGVSRKIFSEGPHNRRLTKRTIDKIRSVFPSFPITNMTKEYSIKTRSYSSKTADEWFSMCRWTGFLMTLPLNKTKSYLCEKASNLMSIRATASKLSNSKECDRVFRVSANFDKNEIIVTANKK